MRRTFGQAVCTLALACFGGCAEPTAEPPSEPPATDQAPHSDADSFPVGWNVADVAAAAPPLTDASNVYVLAWQILDQGAFHADTCLVLRVLDADDGYGRWCLSLVCRHPNQDGPTWRTARRHFSGGPNDPIGHWEFGSTRLKDPVSSADLYRAARRVGWDFHPDNRLGDLVGHGVCRANWVAAVGQPPPDHE